tara:strand:- start:2195 stop:2950 length:756 start_codon:yes stop_codon:yes gene_type:complete
MLNNTVLNNNQDLLSSKFETVFNLSNLSFDNIFNYIKTNSTNNLNYYWLGRRDYRDTWAFQKSIQDSIKEGKLNDIILFLEHSPVYTIGRNADQSNILPTKAFDIDVITTDRGGDVTCHAPGQLIGYPIIDLKRHSKSITWFMRCLEKAIIDMLKQLEIDANRKDELTGVWVDDNKIAALGVRLSRWVSMHGFAINIYTDLKLFRGIIPCGITDFGLTSVLELKKKKYDLLDISRLMADSLSKTFINSNRI